MPFERLMDVVEVSAEMITLIGSGSTGESAWPPRCVAFEIDATMTLTFHAAPSRSHFNRRIGESRLYLIVDRAACERLLDGALRLEDGGSFVMPVELKRIAAAIRDCELHPAAAQPYRLAKSIELVCEILRSCPDRMLPIAASPSLSVSDCQRVAAARQLIDENWGEPLTLAQIARRCGLNRSKLCRGFRELYRCSVTEALLERRLDEASRELVATDLPVGLIAYRSGYQNNASFSRAFCRRFGVPPTNFRSQAMAA